VSLPVSHAFTVIQYLSPRSTTIFANGQRSGSCLLCVVFYVRVPLPPPHLYHCSRVRRTSRREALRVTLPTATNLSYTNTMHPSSHSRT